MKEIVKKIRNRYIFFLLELIFAGICIWASTKVVWMNSVGVSLWLDEAALAYSFSTRGLADLISEPFEWNQIAPAGWLYINKVISIIWGNRECIIRGFSVFSYITTFAVVWAISKYFLKLRLPLLCPAYIATMGFGLKYAIMFKPYVSDGLFTMLAILVWLLYCNKKINYFVVGIVWAILIWFSNPVCFVEGGFLLSEILFYLISLTNKELNINNKRKITKEVAPQIVVIGICISVSFLIYYCYWLQPVATGNEVMRDFWNGQNFPLFPRGYDDLVKMKEMKDEIFVNFSGLMPLMLPGLLVSLLIAINKKDRVIIGIYFGLLIMLFASYINMFPVQDRMWYYFYPLAVLLFFFGLDRVIFFKDGNNEKFSLIILGIVGITLICENDGLLRYKDKEMVYRNGEETNYEVSYLRDQIKQNENIYVYYHSVPGFKYKNGYDTDVLKGRGNRIVYGSGFFEKGTDYEKEIELIRDIEPCYIVMSHWDKERIYGLINDLSGEGWIELVKYDYNTPLLFWTSNMGELKSNVELSLIEEKTILNKTYVTIRVRNNGETIINNPFCKAVISLDDGGMEYELPGMLKPGESTDVEIFFPAEFRPIAKITNSYGRDICIQEGIQL